MASRTRTGGLRGRQAVSGRRRERGPWPHLRETTLTAALEADGKVLDAGQRATVQLLTGRRITRGVYLHGGVGRGKTWLGAEFFNALEMPKLRLHMHALLGQVNQVVASAQAGQPVGIDTRWHGSSGMPGWCSSTSSTSMTSAMRCCCAVS